jgi:hypothetical protein
MKRALCAAGVLMAPALAAAQDPAPVYQPGKQYSVEVKLDGVVRQEWTDSITFIENDRFHVRMRPRVEIGVNRFLIGLGGDFIHGSPPSVELDQVPLLRDNFDPRDARLDLAYVRAQAGAARIFAGRFPMPVRLTEMTWDRELRPQGGALTLEAADRGPFKRLSLTGLGARGSHVFPAEGAFDFSGRETLWLASGSAVLGLGEHSTFEAVGSYLTWSDLDAIDPRLRRQNTRERAGGPLRNGYDVVDLIGRFNREGRVELQLVGDYCWNTAVDSANKGLWLAAVVGSTRNAPAALEYVYSKVDPDATLAAFATDDFLWETGWEGYRGDLGIRLRDHYALHLVGQRQRFKDAPAVADRDRWLERYRIEVRVRY